MNLDGPIRAQSGTWSSRFQTAVDVEHGLRLLDCRMVEYSVRFSATKNGRVITLEVCIKGNLPGFMEI